MSGADVRADFWLSEYITPWDLYAHGIIRILAHRQTPYQDMYVVETGAYGKALVLDGKWQSCTGDEFLYHEGLVHPAMIFHGHPRTVLVLGGGEGATVREVLRWHTVEQVVMVDIDGEVVEACRQHLPEMHQNAFDDPRVEVMIGDALDFIETTQTRWDVIISDLTDPIESGPAFQLFTKEHYQHIQKVLAPDGFLALQAGPTAPAEMHLHTRLANTVRQVFAQAQSYLCHAMSFGSPLGFILASPHEFSTRPDPDAIDRLLADQTTGEFRLMDGATLLGMMQTPKHIQDAIATETQIYTLENPPQPMGRGVMGD
ncbi:MAG: methyltransferase domain-containing protein [Elainellaceae cyanobacterium]